MGMGRPAPKPAAPPMMPGGDGAAQKDPKAAIASMQPEAVNRLVQDALAGKFGPDAQKTAQQATQASPNSPSMPTDNDGDEGQGAQKDDSGMSARNIFSRPSASPMDDGDGDEQDQPGATSARGIFGRR